MTEPVFDQQCNDAGPTQEAITSADVLREMTNLAAPPAIMAEAKAFGDDVEALLTWLRQFEPEDSTGTSLLNLLGHWKVLLKRGTTPLDAELCAAEFLTLFHEAIGEMSLVAGLEHLIEDAATTGSAEALVMCRALAHLGPTDVKPIANRAAHAIAAAGAKDMPWVHSLGEVEFVSAYGYTDPFDSQRSLALEFQYGKRRHAMVLLIDRKRGGGIKDCFFSDDPTRLFAEMRLQALRYGLQLGPHTAERASAIVHAALAAPLCPDDPEQGEHVDNYLPLVRERARVLPRPAPPTGVVHPRSTAPSAESPSLRSLNRPAKAPARSPGRRRSPETVHRIKVTIAGANPPIWRRLEVPSSTTLQGLHAVLQAAFEWEDAHLWSFEVGSVTYGIGDLGTPCADARRSTLREVAPRKGISLDYVYDFGDDWRHWIQVEEIAAANPGETYPRCLAGRRAAPPEDCGGLWGYQELLQILADPGHPEHHERLEWLGLETPGEFDPSEFDGSAVDEILAALVGVRQG